MSRRIRIQSLAANTFRFLLAVLGCAGVDRIGAAAQVGPGAFGGGAVVEDYEGLPLAFSNLTPLAIAGDTYTTDNNSLRYHELFGVWTGRTAYGIGSDTDLGYIDIKLGIPALRAGLYVGVDAQWSADVSFYNVADTLLGTVSTSGASLQGMFAGWQADVGAIARIRVTDTLTNGHVILVDDLIREVPEPSTVLLLATVIAASMYARRSRGN